MGGLMSACSTCSASTLPCAAAPAMAAPHRNACVSRSRRRSSICRFHPNLSGNSTGEASVAVGPILPVGAYPSFANGWTDSTRGFRKARPKWDAAEYENHEARRNPSEKCRLHHLLSRILKSDLATWPVAYLHHQERPSVHGKL